jgi:hypothetical protein
MASNPPPTEPPEQTLVRQLTVTIESTQRPFILAVPPDLTDAEVLEIATWVVDPGGLREVLRPGPQNVVPFTGRLT